ncbi:hypothetical protein Y032_0139g2088 [Ancylostoma ceylanicum]|uniref:G-protein coupled receptors family 1 profile domain-containing protein n=1 Tax=Ancylostoma ceylanicum TaxID=53326 RepID=A0A016T4L8_9BILA|nr:hypothetical protein Y032_0139g2088 [Ancylostoma ceylanicum]
MVYFYSISVIIVAFYGLGLFGNFNIIWATYRKRHLRKKHGLLLASLAGYHIVCISSQWVNLTYSISHQLPRQDECFKWIMPYTFALCAQAMMYVVIVGDLLAAILVPLRHRLFRPLKYVVLISVPVWLYASAITIWGAASVEQKNIMFCNPPLALNGAVNRFWLYSNLAIIVIVVVLHILVWMILKKKGVLHHSSVTSSKGPETSVSLRKTVWRDQRRALHSISAQLVLFLWSWCTAVVGIELFDDFLYKWLPNVQLLEVLQSYMVFFALLCYSQSYYILLWRSPEYSAAFKEQLRIMFRTALDDTTPKANDFTLTDGNRQSGTSIHNL